MAMRYQTSPDVCYQQQGYNQHISVYTVGPQKGTGTSQMLINYALNQSGSISFLHWIK